MVLFYIFIGSGIEFKIIVTNSIQPIGMIGDKVIIQVVVPGMVEGLNGSASAIGIGCMGMWHSKVEIVLSFFFCDREKPAEILDSAFNVRDKDLNFLLTIIQRLAHGIGHNILGLIDVRRHQLTIKV